MTGWRRFVDSVPPTFDLLPVDEFATLTPRQRERYDEARYDFHSEMVTVATSAIGEVTKQGRLLTLLNRREIEPAEG